MDNNKSNFRKEIETFLSIRQLSVGKSTYDADERNILLFEKYFIQNYEGKGCFDFENILHWQHEIYNERNSESKIQSVRLFLQYYSIISNEQVYIPRHGSKKSLFIPYIFSDDEFHKILDFVDNYKKQEYFEISMILRLLYGCGLRLNEALTLKTSDYFIDEGLLFLKNTKFHKERIVPMHKSLANILELYVKRRNLLDVTDEYIFKKNNQSGHILSSSVSNVFRKAMINAGINLSEKRPYERGPCLHSLRHVFTMKSFSQFYEDDISLINTIPYVSFYLGHNSIFETETYLKFGTDMVPFEMKKFEKASANIFPEAKDDI